MEESVDVLVELFFPNILLDLICLHDLQGSVTGRKPLPVRPGMFLETVTKVLGGIYSGKISGITAQHLEWVHQKTLEVLQEIAF
uniref:Uncharacterized protein LOC105125691 n=1 Tax=Rhizophora mucronata TaxID=61149 RepID=A0A2P2KPX4_RHIMU